jgi:hypothetical protein
MTTHESVDFFTDMSLVSDPQTYFDHLPSKNPAVPLPRYGIIAVTQ